MQYSVVSYAKLKKHPEFRIDAECYKTHHLIIERIIENREYKLIQEHSVSVINFGAYSLCNHIEFIESGKPFLVTEDIYNNVIDFTKLHFISESVHKLLYKSHCKKGHVLLTMAGAYLGQAAVFNEDFECSSNQAIAKITLKEESINPYYLSTYLNCKYGQSQIERFRTGTGQPNLNLGLIKLLQVVTGTDDFQKEIEKFVLLGLEIRKSSETQYKQAQILLLSELDLLNWNPKHHVSFIKNYSDTQQAGRFDAEYFQPKYDEIVAAIKSHAGGWDTLGNLVSLKKCIEVGSEQYSDDGIPFVRVSNLSPFETTEEKYISEKLYSELTPKEESDVTFEMSKNHQPKKGEILFSKDATPGIAYFLNEEPPKMIPSGGILRLKLKDKRINPSYLTLVLNSLIVQEQINRDVGGSVILHWRPDQVEKTLIPILKEDKQDEIQQKITESFNLRKQSKHLLECAKKAVEMAIEKDEETAMKWLENQIDSMERGN